MRTLSFNEFYQQMVDDKEIDNLRDLAAQLIVVNEVPPEQFLSELIENTDFGDEQLYNELLGGLWNSLKNKFGGGNQAPAKYNPYDNMNMSGRGEDSFNKANDPSIMFSRAIKILNDIIKVYSDYGYRVKFPDGQRVPLKDFLGKTVNMLNQLRQTAPTADNLNNRREKFFNNAAAGAKPPVAGTSKQDFARNSGDGPSPELRQAFDKRGSLMQQAGMPLEPGDHGYEAPMKKKRAVRPAAPATARNPYEDYVFRAMT